MAHGKSASWFAVDKAGLAQLLERRGKAFAILELIQNAWDQRVTRVDVSLAPLADRRGRIGIQVRDDDPEGFADLRHAFTLFASSNKKTDVSKRGRFNLGEKLVLAICESAQIITTTGTVSFLRDGTRETTRSQTTQGSIFFGTLIMTQQEMHEALQVVHTLLQPPGVTTLVNGVALPARTPLRTFEVPNLLTEIADNDGNLRRTTRTATVEVYEPIADEVPHLYELGIPVVETGDRWHINVHQKIPLTLDRDNVPPSFLRHLRTVVLNTMVHDLSATDATSTWVKEATSDSRVEAAAVQRVLDLRFGTKRVAYDPSDPEANLRAVAAGYTVISGGSLSKDEWAQAKRAGAVVPAGHVTPGHHVDTSPDGTPLHVVPPDRWTPQQHATITFARDLGRLLLGFEPSVRLVADMSLVAAATWGNQELTLNVTRLGHNWFKEPQHPRVIALLLHEFAHHVEANHLSDKFADAIANLGAKLPELTLKHPRLFQRGSDDHRKD